jgi:hypothetical protein
MLLRWPPGGLTLAMDMLPPRGQHGGIVRELQRGAARSGGSGLQAHMLTCHTHRRGGHHTSSPAGGQPHGGMSCCRHGGGVQGHQRRVCTAPIQDAMATGAPSEQLHQYHQQQRPQPPVLATPTGAQEWRTWGEQQKANPNSDHGGFEGKMNQRANPNHTR